MGECSRWSNGRIRESYLCTPEFDLAPPKEGEHYCMNYGGPQRLFCAVKCLTGGCGKNATMYYDDIPNEAEGFKNGFCQPCNGCRLNIDDPKFPSTSVDKKCPSYCTPVEMRRLQEDTNLQVEIEI